MTVKYLHIREIDWEGKLWPRGGMTVAYTVSDVEGMQAIFVNAVKCRPDELFCYRTGREEASKRLKDEGPAEVLDLTHPISLTVVDWVANDFLVTEPPPRGLGYAIDVDMDDKGRWVSTFEPSQNDVSFDPEFSPLLDTEDGLAG